MSLTQIQVLSRMQIWSRNLRNISTFLFYVLTQIYTLDVLFKQGSLYSMIMRRLEGLVLKFERVSLKGRISQSQFIRYQSDRANSTTKLGYPHRRPAKRHERHAYRFFLGTADRYKHLYVPVCYRDTLMQT
jgi:hypothetical protein